MKRTVSPDTLGAWVIKCHPRRTPVEPMVAAGEARSTWCVADNYRSRLMRPGQRVLFWVAAHPLRGFWGAGRITGEVAAEGGTFHVAVHIPLFDAPLTAADLVGVPGLESMEVFRSPQQANPSWLNRTELALLEPLLPPS
ncbi:hypothetical protein JRC04_14775 [Mycolicibacterium sp. S2-37]|uniref:hypothetical protein n=1 Tax=Mycolicibacterium sp. S2-37 TaxID=2810297 RepID=UPI001A95294B|nr:hypothetical protein [Mycolicibacterium sp. S2-37]MBO0678729.1 hypothetical protein [Mycolicibacterium sp. S2-37]